MLRRLVSLAVVAAAAVAMYSPATRASADASVSGWLARTTHGARAALGLHTPSPAERRGFAFENANPDGSPVRWDPCRPIPVLVNPGAAGAAAVARVADALRVLDRASGLRFFVAGTSSVLPSSAWVRSAPAGRWPAVLVGFVRPGQTDLLAGRGPDTIGMSLPAWVGSRRGGVYVTAVVAVDETEHVTPTSAVLMHELGHVAGLGHVADPALVMAPSPRTDTLAAGDLAGLAALGRGGCLATPAP